MPTQVEQLGAQFEAVNDEIIAKVAKCSDEQLRQPCANDGRFVGVVAHHIAAVNNDFLGIVRKFVAGETYSPTTSMEEVHEENAQHAHDYATLDKAETLELLRTNGAAVAQQLRSLRDEQLDHAAGEFGGNKLSVAQVVEWIVIGHAREHLENLRATIFS